MVVYFSRGDRQHRKTQSSLRKRVRSHPLAKSIPSPRPLPPAPLSSTSRLTDLCVTSHKYTCCLTKGLANDSIEAERASRVRTKARKEKERTAIRSKSVPRPSVRFFYPRVVCQAASEMPRRTRVYERVEEGGRVGCAVSHSVFFWSFPEEKNAK